jgi:hypothetical protein
MEGENGKFHHFGGHLGVHPIWGSDANKLPINCQAYIEYADEMMRTKQGCVRMKIEIIKGI